jgi:hypothetical protein
MELNKKDVPIKDLLTAKPAWRSFFVFYTAIIIFSFGPAVNPEVGLGQGPGLFLSLLLLGFVLFRQKTTTYRLTEEAVLREIRIYDKVFLKSLSQADVIGVIVRRGAVHRLLGIGHIQFQSRDGRTDLWWFGLQDPFTLKERADRLLRL